MATKKGGLRDCEGWSRVEMNPGFHPCKAGGLVVCPLKSTYRVVPVQSL